MEMALSVIMPALVPAGGGSERFGDQAAAVLDAVEGDEAAHARALLAAEQGLVQRLEPVAQALLAVMALADLVDVVLQSRGGVLSALAGFVVGEEGIELAQCRGFAGRRRPPPQRGRDEPRGIIHGMSDELVQLRIAFRRQRWIVAPEEAPDRAAVADAGAAGGVEQQREADRQPRLRHLAGMDVVARVAELLVDLLRRVEGQRLVIFIHGAGDDAEV